MPCLHLGRYRARRADSAADLRAALDLRARCFRDGAADEDVFDARFQHVLIEDGSSGRLLGTYRALLLANGSELGRSYAAQFYGLGALSRYRAPMLEVGRFCLAPERRDADLVRIAWGALTRQVDALEVGMLFGCSSFAGTDPAVHRDTFALLHARHRAPRAWRPAVKAPDVVQLDGATVATDARRVAAQLPPLLRSYLAMGGWVSDHAVRDHDLGTLHVFTGLEIASIPPARARALRLVAG
ncbi:MAG: GNAT family N-acyltransferase [Pseudomonadota bacterium]